MKPIDFILLIPLIFGLYDGYKKGFLLVVIGFLAMILGIIGAFKLLQEGIDFLIVYFPHMPKMVPFISFIVLFIAISTGVYLLGILIKKGLSFTIFSGSLDNFMGALVGLCQWAFMLSVVLWLIKESTLIIPEAYIKDSLLFNYIEQLAPMVVKKFEFVLPFAHDLFKSIKHIFLEL